MLNMRLTQNRQHVKCDQKTVLFAQLDISPDESPVLAYKRCHVALVIDCSGSMVGKKIADAKKAAINLVRSLQPNDMVSVVSFDHKATIILKPVPASDRSIEKAIHSIRVGGGTAMHAGMALSYNLTKSIQLDNILTRIELFTDGQPTVTPYDLEDFVQLASRIRDDGTIIDTFGIGDDYNAPLLMTIAETGRGTWQHVSNSEDLTSLIAGQLEEIQNTVISNPQLNLDVMPGAEITDIIITKPTIRSIGADLQTVSGTITTIGLKDIIKDEPQTVAIRIAVPPINGNDVEFLNATITKNGLSVASHVAIISCTRDAELYNMETDPSPRVILSSTEATILLRQGLEGNQEATRMADTILKSLEDPETTRLLDADAQATMINAKRISGNIQPSMSESERKQALYETTVIGIPSTDDGGDERSRATPSNTILCHYCSKPIRASSMFCGHCGKSRASVADKDVGAIKMTDVPDYYGILGVARDATESEIRDAFRNLAKETHPDRIKRENYSGTDFDKKMAYLNKAYEILSNSTLRKEYDASLLKDGSNDQ